jgi:hypothetical protein
LKRLERAGVIILSPAYQQIHQRKRIHLAEVDQLKVVDHELAQIRSTLRKSISSRLSITNWRKSASSMLCESPPCCGRRFVFRRSALMMPFRQ